MASNPTNIPLCMYVSKLIYYLALTGKDAIESLRAMNAVDALLIAVEYHPYEEELLAQLAAALKLLTGAHDMAIYLAFMNSPIEINDKMLAHLNKLAGLLLVPENVEYFVTHKGIPWLIAVLAIANPMNTPLANKILVVGCLALKRCAIDEAKIYEILRHKGVPLLISIINGHMNDEHVVAAGLGALSKLIGQRKENADYLIKHGAVAADVSAIQSHLGSPDLARAGVDLLYNMAVYPTSHDPLVAGDAIPVLCKLVDHYKDKGPRTAPLVTQAIKTLNLLGDDDKNLRSMMDKGHPKNLMNIINDPNQDDLDLIRAALVGLEKLARLNDGKRKLNDLGAIKALQQLMDRFNDEEILDRAGRLIPLIKSLEDAERAEAERRRKEEEEARLRAEMEAAFQKMLADEEAARQAKWKEEQRQKAMREEEERRRKAEEEAEAERIRTLRMKLQSLPDKKPELGKSARALFGDDDEQKGEFELSAATKQFLLAGQLLMKHSKTAQPKQRHFYMSTDCIHLNWKDPKGPILPKNRMKVFKVFGVTRGLETPQLQRKTLQGKPMAREELAFSIHGADDESEEERTVDFEAATRGERERWIAAIEELIEWAKAKKLWGQSTVKLGERNLTHGNSKQKIAHVI